MDHFLWRKEDSPGPPPFLQHHLYVAVAKGQGKPGTEGVGQVFSPWIGRMALLAPYLRLKKDKAGPHPLYPPLHGREHHVEVS